MPGPQGPAGVSVTGAIVDFTTTTAPGTSAGATASFDGAAVRFLFSIPRGADGANGTNGTDGAPGTTGPQGLQGIPGLDGPQGFPGNAGTPGTQGLQGAPGPQGLQGGPGPDGPQGLTGMQGPQGPPGEVTNAALAAAIAGTSASTNAVATMDIPFTNNPATLADMELLRSKINELILAQRR
jgi:hypothetical protein